MRDIALIRLERPLLPIQSIQISRNPGCAYGWNVGLRHLLQSHSAEWAFLVNNDIAFYPGMLKRFANAMTTSIKNEPKFGIGFPSLCCGGEWSAFGVTKSLVQTIGLCDENIFPLFYEENDFGARVHLAKYHAKKFKYIPFIHGDYNGRKKYVSGSMQALQFLFNQTFSPENTESKLMNISVTETVFDYDNKSPHSTSQDLLQYLSDRIQDISEDAYKMMNSNKNKNDSLHGPSSSGIGIGISHEKNAGIVSTATSLQHKNILLRGQEPHFQSIPDDILVFKEIIQRGKISSENYLRLKWGFTGEPRYFGCKSVAEINGICDIAYKHPFNNSKISISDWSLDVFRRRWIITGEGTMPFRQ